MVIKGIFIIMLYYVLGNTVSSLTGHFIPGSVIGMLLLFFSLVAGIVRAETIRTVAGFLTRNMTVFFIPASIGIMSQWGLLSANLIGWLGVTFFSTVLVLAATGLTQDGLIRLGNILKKHNGDVQGSDM